MHPENFTQSLLYRTTISRKRLFNKDVNRTMVRMRDAIRFSSFANVLSPSSYKLHSPDQIKAIDAPFFVVGSPRSGTTLLRELINKHPRLIVPPENGAILRMFQSYCKHRHMGWHTIVDKVIAEFCTGYEASYWKLDSDKLKNLSLKLPHTERTLSNLLSIPYQQYGLENKYKEFRWGDKSTPGSFGYLYKIPYVYPSAQYIVIVRDGRDVVASCINAGFYNNSYIESAEAWVDNNRIIRAFQKSVDADQCMKIRYEDLVTNPDAVVADIFRFLSVSDFKMEPFINEDSGLSKDVLEISHHKNVRKPVTNTSVGKWREKIPVQYHEYVCKIAKNELQYCGYEI